MPQRNVASNFTFEQQRVEINELAADFWTHKGTVDTAAGTYLLKDGSNAFTGGTLAVPNAFTINANSGGGTVTIAGNLQVDGTTTTLNSTTLEIADKNIVLAKGSANDAAADGAGITVDSQVDKTFNFVDADDAFVSSIGLKAVGNITGAAISGTTGTFSGNVNTGPVFTVQGTEGISANLYLIADDGDDNGDGWRINSNQDDNDLTISNNESGSYVDKLTILKTGEVGIGVTPTAGSTLALAGNMQFTAANAQIEFNNGGPRLWSPAANTLTIHTGGGFGSTDYEKMRITSDGKVGIGTDNPGAALTVTGGGGAGAFIYSAGSTNGGVLDLRSTQTSNQTWRLAVGGGDNVYVQGRGFFIRDENASATRFTINDGRVGINKVNPQRALDIETLSNENGFCLNTIGTAANYQFDLRDDGVVQLRVDPTGKISIGEDDPDGNHVLIRGSSTVGTKNGHIMLTGDGADVGQGPQIVFSEAGGGDNWAGGYVGFKRTGGGSVGDLVFGTRTATGDVNTIPTEQLKINSGGDLFVHNGFVQISPTDHDKVKLIVPSGQSDDWAYMTFWGEDGARNAYAGTNASGDLILSRDGGCNLTMGANAVFNADVSDSKGSLRNLPRNEKSVAYTAVTTDKGKFISTNSNVTIDNTATWNTGDAITVYNWGGSPITIVDGTGVLMHYTDGTTASTGDRTLASRGTCTLLCVEGSNNTFVISGAGLT